MNLKELNNLLELFNNQYEKQENKDKILLSSLKQPQKNYSWRKTFLSIKKLSKALKKYLNKGDRCLLISENRPEWLISDFAIMLSECITVPAYTTYIDKDYEYLIDDCKPQVIIVSDINQYNKISNIIKRKNFIKRIFSFEKLEGVNENEYTFLENIFLDISEDDNTSFNINIAREDPACIIYTSGTQGNPKGVILSHGGILSNCEGAIELLKPLLSKKQTKFLTWLPLSHSYEHTVQFIQIIVGAKVFYAESLEKLISNMGVAKPTIMTAVPRFYQNLFTKINMNFEKQKGFKKRMIFQTLILGKKILNKERMSFIEKILNFLCESLVRKKIRHQFGGNLQAFVSGGGPLDQNVGEFLNAIGLPTLQGYGLTETSPVVSCNLPGQVRVETVGPPFRTNQVKIAADGEILIKGENVMLGYWNQKKQRKKF